MPFLGRLLAWLILMIKFKIFQERQDLPILRSLTPRQAELKSHRLVASDASSAQYVKRYEKFVKLT